MNIDGDDWYWAEGGFVFGRHIYEASDRNGGRCWTLHIRHNSVGHRGSVYHHRRFNSGHLDGFRPNDHHAHRRPDINGHV